VTANPAILGTDLPPEETSFLRELRQSRELPPLRARVRELARQGWSQAAIARALDTYRSTVRSWLYYADHSTTAPACRSARVPLLAPELAQQVRVTVLAARLSSDQALELRFLSRSARRVRGHTPALSESRDAAARLDVLLARYRAQGVRLTDLSLACGVTSGALRARVACQVEPPPPPLPPPPLELLDSPLYPEQYYLALWPTPTHTRDRRWLTFATPAVNTVSSRPVAFPLTRLQLPHPATHALPGISYHLLTPRAAEWQLGWPQKEISFIPKQEAATL
jgi:hypothetical protein